MEIEVEIEDALHQEEEEEEEVAQVEIHVQDFTFSSDQMHYDDDEEEIAIQVQDIKASEVQLPIQLENTKYTTDEFDSNYLPLHHKNATIQISRDDFFFISFFVFVGIIVISLLFGILYTLIKKKQQQQKKLDMIQHLCRIQKSSELEQLNHQEDGWFSSYVHLKRQVFEFQDEASRIVEQSDRIQRFDPIEMKVVIQKKEEEEPKGLVSLLDSLSQCETVGNELVKEIEEEQSNLFADRCLLKKHLLSLQASIQQEYLDTKIKSSQCKLKQMIQEITKTLETKMIQQIPIPKENLQKLFDLLELSSQVSSSSSSESESTSTTTEGSGLLKEDVDFLLEMFDQLEKMNTIRQEIHQVLQEKQNTSTIESLQVYHHHQKQQQQQQQQQQQESTASTINTTSINVLEHMISTANHIECSHLEEVDEAFQIVSKQKRTCYMIHLQQMHSTHQHGASSIDQMSTKLIEMGATKSDAAIASVKLHADRANMMLLINQMMLMYDETKQLEQIKWEEKKKMHFDKQKKNQKLFFEKIQYKQQIAMKQMETKRLLQNEKRKQKILEKKKQKLKKNKQQMYHFIQWLTRMELYVFFLIVVLFFADFLIVKLDQWLQLTQCLNNPSSSWWTRSDFTKIGCQIRLGLKLFGLFMVIFVIFGFFVQLIGNLFILLAGSIYLFYEQMYEILGRLPIALVIVLYNQLCGWLFMKYQHFFSKKQFQIGFYVIFPLVSIFLTILTSIWIVCGINSYSCWTKGFFLLRFVWNKKKQSTFL